MCREPKRIGGVARSKRGGARLRLLPSSPLLAALLLEERALWGGLIVRTLTHTDSALVTKCLGQAAQEVDLALMYLASGNCYRLPGRSINFWKFDRLSRLGWPLNCEGIAFDFRDIEISLDRPHAEFAFHWIV